MGSMTATEEHPPLPAGPLTVADLEAFPDDGHRYELLDGVLIVTPAPGFNHQMVVGQLFRRLDETAPADLVVLPAPFAIHPDAADGRPQSEQSTELQPDVLIAELAAFTAKDLPGAPLLAVEVLSPSTQLFDRNLKKAAYEQMGAAHFWLIDPRVPELFAFALDETGTYQLVGHAGGDEVFRQEQPFPVEIRPAELLRRRR
jgi:Uma2 family endonuclease